MAFSNIIGNKAALSILRNSLASGRVACGYLFEGPEGVGKKLAAINFAKSLNCAEKGEEPCDQCNVCRRIDAGIHPDVHLFSPRGKARMIKVEQIRELIEQISLMAFEAPWKVFIIDDAECMNQESQNKLLKTLEEPPSQTVLILVSSQPARLLPTIISRCQKIVFHNIPPAELERYMKEQLEVEPAKARLISALAHGRISRVHRLMEEENFLRRQKVITLLARGKFDHFADLVAHTGAIEEDLNLFSDRVKRQETEAVDKEYYQSMSAAERTELNQQIAASVQAMHRAEIEEVLNLLALWYRDMLILKTSGNETLVKNVDKIDDLKRSARELALPDLLRFLEEIEKIRAMILRNMKLTFCLHVLFIRLGFLG